MLTDLASINSLSPPPPPLKRRKRNELWPVEYAKISGCDCIRSVAVVSSNSHCDWPEVKNSTDWATELHAVQTSQLKEKRKNTTSTSHKNLFTVCLEMPLKAGKVINEYKYKAGLFLLRLCIYTFPYRRERKEK